MYLIIIFYYLNKSYYFIFFTDSIFIYINKLLQWTVTSWYDKLLFILILIKVFFVLGIYIFQLNFNWIIMLSILIEIELKYIFLTQRISIEIYIPNTRNFLWVNY